GEVELILRLKCDPNFWYHLSLHSFSTIFSVHHNLKLPSSALILQVCHLRHLYPHPPSYCPSHPVSSTCPGQIIFLVSFTLLFIWILFAICTNLLSYSLIRFFIVFYSILFPSLSPFQALANAQSIR